MNKFLDSIYIFLRENNINGLSSIHTVVLLLFSLKSKFFNATNITTIKEKLKSYSININDTIQLDSVVADIKNMDDSVMKDVVNNIFMYYFENENLNIIKDYTKYYNNKLLVKYIVDMANINENNTIYDGNVKINSFMEEIIYKSHISLKDKIYGNTTNNMIKDIVTMQLLDKTPENYSMNISSDDLLTTGISYNKSFDVIFLDFPSGIHNIIHANCCAKIKKLKLRGTKSEPLLLQLVMTNLNKNGKAILVVPDSLLFSDSLQPTETRKYLLENFNIRKIVEINESFYISKGVKNSILYFENTGKTTSIEFSSINITNNSVTQVISSIVNIKDINSNYSLWYKHYMEVNKMVNNTTEYQLLGDVLNIHTSIPTENGKYLVIDKYFENDMSVKIVDDIKDTKYAFYLNEKDTSNNNFILSYMERIIKRKPEQFTKGKMNQFELSKLSKYAIPVISKDKMATINNYIKMSNKIVEENNNMIKQNNLLKQYLLETIPLNCMVELNSVSTICDTNDNMMIGVIRNGLSAGTVYLLNKGDMINKNSHYLKITDNNINVEFVYHWLKYMENKLKEISNLTSQPNLNKSNLIAFKIPSIPMEDMKQFVIHCNDFDIMIDKYSQSNIKIKEKDIFSTFLHLYNL